MDSRYYVDGIEYNNAGQIDQIHTPEGFLLKVGGVYTYHYAQRDHLGSTRVVWKEDGSLLQEHDYFPFGLNILSGGVQQPEQYKYQYNGKEKQDALGWVDYGARMYDPVVGRWFVLNPKTEKMPSFSPYNYCLNNPINTIDPDGEEPVSKNPNSWKVARKYHKKMYSRLAREQRLREFDLKNSRLAKYMSEEGSSTSTSGGLSAFYELMTKEIKQKERKE